MSPRRFPVPWIIRPLRFGAGYEVRDARGQRLVLIEAHENDFAAYNIGVLTLDEARRIATGVARLPGLLQDQWAADDALAERLPARIESFPQEGGAPVEIARLANGALGLHVFEAFVRCVPDGDLMLSAGTHRLALHRRRST
jgi:hypothetical protein